MMTKEGATKVLSRVGKMQYFISSSFVLLCMDQTNYVNSNDDQGRVYQNYNLMTAGQAWILL